MKKWIIIMVLFCISSALTLFESGCVHKEPVLIGVVGTMTGNNSDLSVSGRRGIEMAVKEINESGGINGRLVELVIKDDKNDPGQAEKIVDEFVNEGIELVIGNYTSGMLLAAYDTIIKSNLLYLAPTVSADSLNGIDDNFIRFIPTTALQADIIIQDVKKNKYNRFLIISDQKNIGFSEALRNNFEEQLINNNGSVVSLVNYETLDQSKIDEIISILNVENSINSIFIISGSSDIAAIAQQLTKYNIKLPIYGPLWAHTGELINNGGTSVEGIKIVSGIDLDSKKNTYIEFQNTYKIMFGEEVTFAAMYSYETMMAMAEVIKETKKTDWKSVKEALIDQQLFYGIQDEFKIDRYGDNLRTYGLDTIRDGVYKRVE